MKEYQSYKTPQRLAHKHLDLIKMSPVYTTKMLITKNKLIYKTLSLIDRQVTHRNLCMKQNFSQSSLVHRSL